MSRAREGCRHPLVAQVQATRFPPCIRTDLSFVWCPASTRYRRTSYTVHRHVKDPYLDLSRMGPRSYEYAHDSIAAGRPSLLIIGLGPTGVEVALALAESNRCCVSLGDDALASTEWRKSTSCLLNGGCPSACNPSAANAGVGKTMKRSQFLAALLTSISAQSIRALSPVGDAPIVERFDVVVMTDPTLPHAIAFNEHVSDDPPPPRYTALMSETPKARVLKHFASPKALVTRFISRMR